MEIVWLRDPNSITALHTKLLPTFFDSNRLMDSLFGTVHFLLWVGSFGCSIFIPLRLLSSPLYSMMCILVFASLYYLVCSSNNFTFLFFGISSAHVRSRFCFLLFPLFPFFQVHCLLWQRCPSKIISFGGLSTTVRSFLYLAVLFFMHPIFLSPFSIQNWWIIRLRVPNSISKISIAYVFYTPPQSDIVITIISDTSPGLVKLIVSTLRYQFLWLLC